MLSKQKVGKEEEHILEIDGVIVDVNSSVVVAIWEAKIKLAEDLENSGSWNVVGWREVLAKITGKPVTATKDPGSNLVKEEKEKDAANDDHVKV